MIIRQIKARTCLRSSFRNKTGMPWTLPLLECVVKLFFQSALGEIHLPLLPFISPFNLFKPERAIIFCWCLFCTRRRPARKEARKPTETVRKCEFFLSLLFLLHHGEGCVWGKDCDHGFRCSCQHRVSSASCPPDVSPGAKPLLKAAALDADSALVLPGSGKERA